MVVKTRRRQRAGVPLRGDLCYDSWSLSHLGYLYPGTTPVMIKLDHDRSCPWVEIAQVTKVPTINTGGLSTRIRHKGGLTDLTLTFRGFICDKSGD